MIVRKKANHVLLVLMLLASAAFPVAAADSPESVFDAYMASLKDRGVSSSAEFLHPDDLARFRAMLGPLFQSEGRRGTAGLVRGFFGSSATPESVRAMPDVEFARTVLGMFDAQMKAVGTVIGDHHVLGSVKEGEVTHLVVRSSASTGELQITKMEVVSLRPNGSTWRVMLSGEMEGMTRMLKAQFGASE